MDLKPIINYLGVRVTITAEVLCAIRFLGSADVALD
jgi:hypothetical protein